MVNDLLMEPSRRSILSPARAPGRSKARLDGALAARGDPTFNISAKCLPFPLFTRYLCVRRGSVVLVEPWKATSNGNGHPCVRSHLVAPVARIGARLGHDLLVSREGPPTATVCDSRVVDERGSKIFLPGATEGLNTLGRVCRHQSQERQELLGQSPPVKRPVEMDAASASPRATPAAMSDVARRNSRQMGGDLVCHVLRPQEGGRHSNLAFRKREFFPIQ
jgi:hypothetical protein